MVARAVSAERWLTPLAVLILILATVVAAFVTLNLRPPLVLVAVPAGLAITAIAGRRTYGLPISLATAGLTLAAGTVAFVVFAWASWTSSICGKTIADGWLWPTLATGAFVYFGVGIYGLRTGREVYVVPAALLSGALTVLALFYLVPGTPGFCD
jgi:hypothetical protein